MDLSFSSLFQSASGYLKKMSKGRRLALAGVIVAVLVGAVILANVLQNASYAVLYRGLSASEGIEIVNLLDKSGVNYRLQNDGSIMVPKSNEAMIKMQLAAEGFPQSTLGYDVFSSNTDLMTTDYEKKQYLVFQLQDRLQASLKTLTGVRDAIVTLNIPDDTSYVLKTDKPEATASVMLDLYAYADLSKQQITGIEELVAKSVPGLKAANVVIVDNEGTVLNVKSDEYGVDLALSQMETVKKINDLYKQKIVDFLEPVFGADGMSVAVNVQVDFQQKTTQQTTYTPVVGEQGILSKEEFDRQSVNGGRIPGAVAGTETNTGVPTYEEGDGEQADGASASDSGSNEYFVNQKVEGIQDGGGKITDMTVSVMINSRDLLPETIEKYREMVAFGAGIPVEKVVVNYAEFLAKPNTPIFTEQAGVGLPFGLTLDMLMYIGIGMLSLIIGLIVLVILLLKRKKKSRMMNRQQAQYQQPNANRPQQPQRPQQAMQRPQQPQNREEDRPQGEHMAQTPGEIVLSETREMGLKRQVKEFAAVNPETVAQLIRTWMKEDDA